MTEDGNSLSRRNVIASAGAGVGAGLLAQLDMTANLPVVDPLKMMSPVLLLRGEYDGIASVDDLSAFYKQLPSGDRQFVILPATAHSVVLGSNRQLFWHVMRAFLTMPAHTEV
jgi:alpha-beta hydrolase superfamily lysophospholipase